LIQEQGPARFVREPNNKAKSHWNHFIYSFLNLLDSSSGIVLEWTISTSVKTILYLMSLRLLTYHCKHCNNGDLLLWSYWWSE
jgi:hypothetical protein